MMISLNEMDVLVEFDVFPPKYVFVTVVSGPAAPSVTLALDRTPFTNANVPFAV
jgi:hypothetical protein